LFLLASLTTQKEKFYYAFNNKIVLVTKPNTLLVKYEKGTDKNKSKAFIMSSVSDSKMKWHDSLLVEIDCKTDKNKEKLESLLKQKSDVTSCFPFYTLANGSDMGVSDEILIRFLPEVNSIAQKKLHNKLKTRIIKTTKIYQKLIVEKGSDAVEIANQYYESGLVEFAQPNFISYPTISQITPNDTYFNNQITCNNTGQTFTDGHSGTADADIDASEAWEITRGCSDVIVAVLDEGVTSNHPDLPNTRQIRLNGSNFTDGNADDPSPTGDMNHGNACAGVIAATMNNNQGIAGIAPNCQIMPIRIFDSNPLLGLTPDEMADAIEFAVDNGADILSNSWGYGSSDQNLHPVIVTAINYAINNNRVVIFAAGNNADHNNNDDGYVSFPANANISNLITVGASDRNDNQANYSPTGSLIDVVAPSNRSMPWLDIAGETYEMWSIDIPDSAGYNSWHSTDLNPPAVGEVLPSTGTNHLAYTARFGGTSHSCPVVAGVAALLLSVDPSLTPQEVFNILTSTANDVGGYTYSNGRCNEMGHGRVNAEAAILEVIDQFTVTGPNVVCYSTNPLNASDFTASNSPTCSTIDWTTSSNLEVVDGDNTLTATINAKNSTSQGAGWVQINYILDSVTTAGPRQDVWVGKFANTVVTGQAAVCPNSLYVYTAQVPIGDPSDYTYVWTYPSGWYKNSQWDNKIQLRTPQYNMNYGTVRVKINNGCDFSNYSGITVYPGYCGGYYMSFTPNPTTGETVLTIEPGNKEITFDETAEWELEIYSPAQTLKEKKTKLKGNSTTIQTHGWQEGVYVVRVKYNPDGKLGEILTGKLVVKR